MRAQGPCETEGGQARKTPAHTAAERCLPAGRGARGRRAGLIGEEESTCPGTGTAAQQGKQGCLTVGRKGENDLNDAQRSGP